MILSQQNLQKISADNLIKPSEEIFSLPEKILQFGTGVLLRGLPDYFIDNANRNKIFNGGIVVVKSTDANDITIFKNQDNLYTLCIRGMKDEKEIEENIICSAISRVLFAKTQWSEVLKYAQNKDLQIIISNTTEVGIQLTKENIFQQPPISFPGKLLVFLFERYKFFDGSSASGIIIIPTELIPDNAKKLKAILIELAEFNQLEKTFINWIKNNNFFCNSLVDRIVPGKPDKLTKEKLQQQFGYKDELMIIAESYCLWAIEGDEHIKSILSFAQVNKEIIIAPNIEIYRELKLRLLNGTHTLCCGFAFLLGFETVKQAMNDKLFSKFIEELMLKEIAAAIPYKLSKNAAQEFGLKILDRFRNPSIKHQWLNISLQYTSKMQMRNIPVLIQYYKIHNSAPEFFALGFAAYLLFMKSVKKENDNYFGELNGKFYLIKDDSADYFYKLWQQYSIDDLVKVLLQNKSLWQIDLTQFNGLMKNIKEKLYSLIEHGPKATLARLLTTK
ncbi:MAG: tagaturonate reductase [Chitinophagaceae bacterium]